MHANSTTHYPSWGSGTRRWPPGEPPTEPSLPLMGIGNVGSSFTAPVNSSSLPLMGIGNWLTACTVLPLGRRRLITAHGDRERTHTSEHVVRPSEINLITPHGDREHDRARRRAVGVRHLSSLPLMGIGNPRATRDPKLLGHVGISLPLMGIGNSKCSSAVDGMVFDFSHYPSWGSGTYDINATGMDATPEAHYPSWGSGTVRRSRSSLLSPDISLPLMGIGNKAMRRPEPSA